MRWFSDVPTFFLLHSDSYGNPQFIPSAQIQILLNTGLAASVLLVMASQSFSKNFIQQLGAERCSPLA